jgi:hypothetical protein
MLNDVGPPCVGEAESACGGTLLAGAAWTLDAERGIGRDLGYIYLYMSSSTQLL